MRRLFILLYGKRWPARRVTNGQTVILVKWLPEKHPLRTEGLRSQAPCTDLTHWKAPPFTAHAKGGRSQRGPAWAALTGREE